MDLENVIYKLRRTLDNKINALSLSVTSGGVDNMNTYKYITGQIAAFEAVLQDISNLLEKKEHYEDTGNVIRIDKDERSPKN